MQTTDSAAAAAPSFNPFPSWASLDLQARIRVMMALRDVSKKDLAEATGISPAGLTMILANTHGGGRNDTVDTLRRLAGRRVHGWRRARRAAADPRHDRTGGAMSARIPNAGGGGAPSCVTRSTA